MMLEFLEERTVVRGEIEEEDEQYGGVKSENSEGAIIYSEDSWGIMAITPAIVGRWTRI
jgi:vacuolar-type H+-ATPase subunit E/Vma4